ncbi:MotA/TolQ/ExbB proton channel family protein [Dysgonomonas sp. 520]|uniref:MotA/TolQ/ExbB proton channel family protein n=1 Tax=Dysgonomonas sp. 520 TaxID=2302931 RepID=UPI0013D09A09|nr:MotA/TolQ/ExbB proton channel family protein [Dysgonomonas sp. 520]NDW08622.1 MotA/TolQ/ExbB proton channel family protein [Dysgonomonas sp. 520]
MNLLFVLLQDVATNVPPVADGQGGGESYLSLLMKGGLIMIPLFLLSLLAIYIIIDRWFVIRKMGKKDSSWLSRVMELIYENKTEKALKFALEKPYASGKVVAAGLKEGDDASLEDIENAMQIESRQQISVMEKLMNYLGITASIAPMLGFLGTIFGVIKIFYNISVQGDIQISTISEGLYEKMICSGAGLFVGIIAYAGFYILNGMIDKVVLRMDKDANDALRAIKSGRNLAKTVKNED